MKYPTLMPTINNRYEVVEDYITDFCTVPKGYVTNGANIPRFLWWYIAPNTPKYMHAIVIHDYLCDLEQYEYADESFENYLYQVEKVLKLGLW